MNQDIWVRWATDSVDDARWLSSELFNSKKAENTKLFLICLAIGIRHSCPREGSYQTANTGPRTGLNSPNYRVLMAAAVLHHFASEVPEGLTSDQTIDVLQNYANGGLRRLVEILEDSKDRLGTLVTELNGLLQES